MGLLQVDQWTANMIERLVLAAEERNELLRKQNELLANIASELKEQRTGPAATSGGIDLDVPF